jgi:hypothetical protein
MKRGTVEDIEEAMRSERAEKWPSGLTARHRCKKRDADFFLQFVYEKVDVSYL